MIARDRLDELNFPNPQFHNCHLLLIHWFLYFYEQFIKFLCPDFFLKISHQRQFYELDQDSKSSFHNFIHPLSLLLSSVIQIQIKLTAHTEISRTMNASSDYPLLYKEFCQSKIMNISQKENIANLSNLQRSKLVHNSSNFQNRSLEDSPSREVHKPKTLANKSGRHCKSTRRNLLSCQQILDIARKRDTCSMSCLSLNYNGSSRIYGNGNTTEMMNLRPKSKKKEGTVKNIDLKKDENKKSKGMIKGKTKQKKNRKSNKNLIKNPAQLKQHDNNFVVSYPLSQSNSFIVFSDKDHSLGSTKKHVDVLAKKLSGIHQRRQNLFSKKSKVQEIPIKLVQIKIQHAAVIIQKHWRGFLTRKLLRECIEAEEPKIQSALRSVRIKSHFISQIDDKVMKEIEEIDKRQKDAVEDLSEILENFQIKQSEEKQRNKQASKSEIESDQSGQFHEEVQEEYDNDHSRGREIQDEGMIASSESKSRLQLLSSHQQISLNFKNQASEANQNEKKRKYVENKFQMNKFEQSNIKKQQNFCQTSMDMRNVETQCQLPQKRQQFEVFDSYNIVVRPERILKQQIKNQENPETFSQISIKMTKFLTKNREILSEEIKSLKESLVTKMKSQRVNFDEMLRMRNQLKQVNDSIQNLMAKFERDFTESVEILAEIIDEKEEFLIINDEQKSNQAHYQEQSQQNSEDGIGIDHENLLQDPQSLIREGQQKTGEPNTSPISQYYVVDLPTEQLSPHKKPFNISLQNIKTYIESIYEQCNRHDYESETTFLCEILKKKSETGAENMIERCLIQMLVEILTEGYELENLLMAISIEENKFGMPEMIFEEDNYGRIEKSVQFVKKWVDQLQKWELGPIEEVSRNMQQSADVTEHLNSQSHPRSHKKKSQNKISPSHSFPQFS